MQTLRIADVPATEEGRRRLIAAMAEKGYSLHWEVRDAEEKVQLLFVRAIFKDAEDEPEPHEMIDELLRKSRAGAGRR